MSSNHRRSAARGLLGEPSGGALLLAALVALAGCSTGLGDRAPQEALAAFDVYPGLEATLFAAEPTLSNPTNIDVDDRGRVWVCDVVNYREHGRNDRRPEGDRILILEDTDGDGVSDSSKVYYQGRDIDAALGIAVLGNKVIVTAAPDVIVFTDEDGDDIPDTKESLFVQSGKPQDDHSTHSLSFGPDGKMYWNMGNAGRYIHDRDGRLAVDGFGDPVLDRNYADSLRERPDTERPEFTRGFEELASPFQGGMVFRCNPDGSELEVLAHNFRNNYEVAIDSLGALWQSDNDDDGSYACRLNYIVEGGNYGYRDELTGARNQAERTGMHPEVPQRHWHQNDPGVVPNLLVTGAGSPTGVASYEGRLLPSKFWDQILATDAGPGVLRGVVAEKVGAGYAAKAVKILKGERDKWVRPVDVAVAPDGSLFVSDWYDPVIGWNRQEDSGRGRIFRVAPVGHRYRPAPPQLDSVAGRVEALKSPNAAVRYLAWQALDGGNTEVEDALVKLFREEERVRLRARALWLLARIESRGPDYVREALKDPEEDIRVVGLRAAKRTGMDLIPLVDSLAEDPSAHVRRECAVSLRGSKSSEAPGLWARLASQHVAGDRWSLEALGIAAEGRWDACIRAWMAVAGQGWDSPAGRDIVWRSRSAATPGYLVRILGSKDMGDAAAARYMRAFDFQASGTSKERALRQLAFGPSTGGRTYSFFVASEALLRLPTLDLAQDARTRGAIETLLDRGEGTAQFARLVQRYELAERYPSLLEVAAKHSNSPIGIASARTLLQAGAEQAILEFIASDADLSVAAVEAVGNTRMEQSIPVLRDIVLNAELSPPVRDAAVRSLAGTNLGARELVEMARAGDFPPDLAAVAGAAMARSMNVRLRQEANKLFPVPPLKGGEPVPQMTELLVYEGNSENGARVFDSATCSDCHIVNGQGTNFGPELSKIGDKLSKAGIYESILDPSAGVSPDFQLVNLTLASEEVSGFVINETAEAVTLRMEGGIVDEFAVDQIRDRRESTVSAMPDDLQEQMSVDDLVDLVEYLSRLR